MATNRIRALRKEAGYNQKELGEQLGVGQTTVSAWEIGRNEPDNELSHKMAQLFGCSIGYLMGYEPESEHRGLSVDEWNKFTARKQHEYQVEKELRSLGDMDDEYGPDEEEIEEWEQIHREEEWEKNDRRIFPESIAIDAILERTDTAGRQRAVKVIELMFPHSAE